MGNDTKSKIKDIPQDNNIYRDSIKNYPKFCFKYLQETSIKNSKNHKFFIDFLFRLKKLSELGWNEINKSPKHSFGTEKISIEKIKQKQLPEIITPDVKKITVFRADGSNKPFLGLRTDDIFHVIFIEANFGDIYEHN
jgi:hypothetical protein